MARILVVDDEKMIVKGIRFSLLQEGWEVDAAYDGEEALTFAKQNDYDMVLLDIMLPKLNGLEVCQQIREFSNVPVIMLTAKGDDMDKIIGLEYGADDYITKPFNILEVKARMKAIMRRNHLLSEMQQETKNAVLKLGELRLDLENQRLFVSNREISVTQKEFDVIKLLASEPNHVFSREKLLELIWGTDFPGDIRTVDVHVRRLREKIEPNPAEPIFILTKWGTGYFCKDEKNI